MTKNPFINALSATLYISVVAAVMGYLFLSQPLQMYIDGAKKPAVKLFLQTLVSFAVITILIFGLMLGDVIN